MLWGIWAFDITRTELELNLTHFILYHWSLLLFIYSYPSFLTSLLVPQLHQVLLSDSGWWEVWCDCSFQSNHLSGRFHRPTEIFILYSPFSAQICVLILGEALLWLWHVKASEQLKNTRTVRFSKLYHRESKACSDPLKGCCCCARFTQCAVRPRL